MSDTTALLHKVLKFEKTPDPPQLRGPRYRGKKTKMGLYEFISCLFLRNEEIPQAEKMTDAEIRRQILEEFPDTKCSKHLEEGSRTIGWYRTRYNRGEMLPNVRALKQVVSLRYDIDGEPIHPKTRRPIGKKKARALYGSHKEA